MFLVLNKGLNCASRKALVLDDSWFTSPIKDRNAVRLDHIGKLATALKICDGRVDPVAIFGEEESDERQCRLAHFEMLSAIF